VLFEAVVKQPAGHKNGNGDDGEPAKPVWTTKLESPGHEAEPEVNECGGMWCVGLHEES
jgi:hypothetical protein